MKLSYKIALFFVIVSIFLLVIFMSLTVMFNNAKEAESIQKHRFDFYKKVIKHKQNSEIFSDIFVRYLNTNSKEYKSKVDEVLNAGDFVHGDIKKYRNEILVKLGYKYATAIEDIEIKRIQEFFRKLDISEEKFNKLFKASEYTRNLLALEFEAINASRGVFKDENGQYNVFKAPSKDYAQRIILSEEYKNLRQDIRENINKTFLTIDVYLLSYVTDLEEEETHAYQFIILLSFILLAIVIASYFNFKRDIINPLDQLNLWIKQMKENQFEIKDTTFPKDEIGIVMNSFYKMADTIRKDITELERLSTTDPLTKLCNRVTLDKALEDAYYNIKRYETPCSLIILDIDYFKMVNDTYGHNVGDMVLKEFALILKKEVRLSDTLGRWGGEEFLIICNNTEVEGARLLAEKLRARIETFDFKDVGHKTASFGITSFSKELIIEEVLDKADKALYEAKEGGRNQVIVK